MKLQEVVTRSHPMSPAQVATVISALNFGPLPGLDPNPNNVVAAARYVPATTFNPLCMCRCAPATPPPAASTSDYSQSACCTMLGEYVADVAPPSGCAPAPQLHAPLLPSARQGLFNQ